MLDYHIITLVTAGGSLIRGGIVYFEAINDNIEDLEKLIDDLKGFIYG